MTHKALIRRLQISCLGLDAIDPLRLLVDDVIEALREHAMREVQRLGQEIEQEPVALPCCGYADASAVKWNPHNQVVQCHNCGQVYETPPQRTDQEPVAWMKPHEKCDRACMYLCTKGFTQFPECALLQRKPMTEEFIMDSTRELSMDVRWPSSFIDVWRLCEATHGVKK